MIKKIKKPLEDQQKTFRFKNTPEEYKRNLQLKQLVLLK